MAQKLGAGLQDFVGLGELADRSLCDAGSAGCGECWGPDQWNDSRDNLHEHIIFTIFTIKYGEFPGFPVQETGTDAKLRIFPEVFGIRSDDRGHLWPHGRCQDWWTTRPQRRPLHRNC